MGAARVVIPRPTTTAKRKEQGRTPEEQQREKMMIFDIFCIRPIIRKSARTIIKHHASCSADSHSHLLFFKVHYIIIQIQKLRFVRLCLHTITQFKEKVVALLLRTAEIERGERRELKMGSLILSNPHRLLQLVLQFPT
jgi:hypothetical protein